ncbi:hypothetical protein Droror1_Dr00027805 [Drosera rotundifolia]
MTPFSHPTIPRSEIVAVLNECRIAAISETDIQNPSPKFVFDVYSALLFYLDVLQDGYGQVEFEALERFENLDWHVDSVRVMNLCNKIKEFLAGIGCSTGFTFNDLAQPVGNRTLKFLSAFVNYILYKNAKMEALRPDVESFSHFDEQRKEVEARISQLNAEKADYNKAREEEMPLVQELDSKVKELRQTVPSLNNHQVTLRASLRKMKEKTKEVEDKVAKTAFDLVLVGQDAASLKAKIVQSPDKLQRVLEEDKVAVLEAKNRKRMLMQSYKEKSSTFEVNAKALKKMSKQTAQMKGFEDQVSSAKAIEKEVKQGKTKLTDDGIQEISLEAKLVEREGKADQVDQQKERLQKEKELKYQQGSKEFNKVKIDVESRRHTLEAIGRRVKAVFVEVDSTKVKISSCKDSGTARQQLLLKKLEEILYEFHLYNQSANAVLSEIDAPRG